MHPDGASTVQQGGRAGPPGGIMIRAWRSYALALLVLVGAACSTTELVYDNADWLLYRWVDGMVDARDGQSTAWRALMREAMDRHRRELLRPLVQLILGFEEMLRRRLDEPQLSCWLAAADRVYRAHAEWAGVPAVEVLAGLAPDQVAYLDRQFEERDTEYADGFLDPDAQRRERRRVERYVDRIERWTGDLSTEQLRLVEAMVGGLPDLADDWFGYRQRQQQRLLELLRSGADREALRQFLRAWWVDLAGREAPLVSKSQRVRQGVIALLVNLDGTLSQTQRARALDRLAELRAELTAAGDLAGPVLLAAADCPPKDVETP